MPTSPNVGLQNLRTLEHIVGRSVGYLPLQALVANIERGNVSLALENDEPAAYLLGKGNYLRDPHFGIIYQAAVSYDARRRLLGTALVQHFMDHMERATRLIGLWCAQDIEANEFWNACGFEAIAARHGSRRRGRVHIFWVGRTQRGRHEQLRYPRYTQGGLMREHREVFGLKAGEEYKEVVLPEPPQVDAVKRPRGGRAKRGSGAKGRRPSAPKLSLIEQQRAFRYGHSGHICVVIAGVTKYLPVAPFEMPNFTDLARAMTAVPGGGCGGGGAPVRQRGVVRAGGGGGGELWTPAQHDEDGGVEAA